MKRREFITLLGGAADAIATARVEAVNVLASPQLNAARDVIIERTRNRVIA